MIVNTKFRLQGSVLADTVQGEAVGIDTRLEVDSPEAPENVARLIRTAERGCFVMQALKNPVAITSTTLLNGAPLDGV